MIEATEETLPHLLNAPGWTLVTFSDESCEPVRRDRWYVQFIAEQRSLNLVLVDADRCPSAWRQFDASRFPVYQLRRDGALISQHVGEWCRYMDGEYKGGRGRLPQWIKRCQANVPV